MGAPASLPSGPRRDSPSGCPRWRRSCRSCRRAFGTVMLKKNVARPVAAASAAIRSVRTFSMMWMPLSVSSILWTMNASLGFSPGITSTAQVSVPTATTFWRDQPGRRVLADARLAAVVERVLRRELLEEVAPAGVDDDDVALAQGHVVHLEAGLDVGRGDQRCPCRGRASCTAALVLNLPAAWNTLTMSTITPRVAKRLQVLEAELGHVVLVDELAHRRSGCSSSPCRPMWPMPSRCVPTWLWLSQVSSM